MTTAPQGAVIEILKTLRADHQQAVQELLDPSMKLFHERNGGLTEATEPFLALARSTVDRLDQLIAHTEDLGR
jgi:hypothetical protein